jgi:RimJ/RimL family protein N-acetyltransferase
MSDRRDGITIKTPRLTLRPLAETDAPALATGAAPFAVSRWLSEVPHPYGLQDARDFLAGAAGQAGVWAILWRDELVGTISADGALGYWLAEPAWGRGLATEAGLGMVDHWFSVPANGDLEASHFEGNAASAAVLRKLGFDYTGATRIQTPVSQGVAVRSHEMRLTRAQWERRRSLPHLQTERYRLRPLCSGDAPRLIEFAGQQDLARQTSSIPAPWPEAEAREWIAAGAWKARPGFRLGICDGSGRLSGVAGISPMDENDAASVAYIIEKHLWGRGIATEVMSALIPAVFRDFPLTALTADHFTDNPASGAILRKLGFQPCGESPGTSRARLEPAPVSHYRLERSSFEART